MNGPTDFTILLAGKKVKCVCLRSGKARYIHLRIGDENSLSVTLPQNARLRDAETAVRRHARWILSQLRRRELENRTPPFFMEEGRELPLLNEKRRLTLLSTERSRAFQEENPDSLRLHLPAFDQSAVPSLIREWYTHKARIYLKIRILHWSRRMTVHPGSFRVKNQKTLWGSCSRKGNLNFNWRMLLLPEETADYLIIHELAHLRHMNHSPRFWSEVARFCPDYRRHRRILRERNHWLRFPEAAGQAIQSDRSAVRSKGVKAG